MATKVKIKITDNRGIRTEIGQLAELLNHGDLVQWALICAKHILLHSKIELSANEIVAQSLDTMELWQKGKATIQQVRSIGLKIHTLAQQCKAAVDKAALQTIEQAVAVAHMRGRAMVCADYAIKTVQLAHPDRLDKITSERHWQLSELKHYLES